MPLPSHHPARRRPADRGNTLLIAIILFLVMAILVVGSLSQSGVEVGAARTKADFDAISACARGGRELLLSQFRLSNAQPKQIDVSMPGPGNDLRIASGHYDSPTPLPAGGSEGNATDVASGNGPSLTFQIRPSSQAASGRGAEDLANRMSGGAATDPATYVIVCEDRSGKRYEMEFTVLFGF